MRALRPALLLVALSGPAFSGVIVVDAGGGGQFTVLQAAVDAAQDGDVLLVRSGTYATFAIADRSVTVAADQGAVVEILGAVRIRNLSPGRTAVLSGLSARGSGLTEPQRHGLFLTSNAGSVRIQDCSFEGSGGVPAWYRAGYAGAVVRDCADVALNATFLLGGAAGGGEIDTPSIPRSGAGLHVERSTVNVHAGACTGGSGLDLGPHGTTAGWDGGDGGPGLVASDATVVASGSLLRGGRGGNAAWFAPLFGAGGRGGNGAELTASTAYLLDTPTLAGAGGWGTMGSIYFPTTDGAPGQARVGANFVDWAGSARYLLGPGPRREGETLTLTLQGPAGDDAALGFAADADYVLLPPASGAWLLERPRPPQVTRYLSVGTVPASGLLAWSRAVPELGVGVATRLVHVQALCIDAAGNRFLSGARVLIQLDQAL